MKSIPVTPKAEQAAAPAEAETQRRMARIRANTEFEQAMGPGYVLHIDTAFTRPWKPRFLGAALRPFQPGRAS